MRAGSWFRSGSSCSSFCSRSRAPWPGACGNGEARSRSELLVRVLDLALGDFFEGHRQVVLRARLHERRRVVVEGALTELVVVVVDLPRALGGDDHECVALVDVFEQRVDAWMDHGRDMLAESLLRTISARSESARSTSSFTTR